MSVGAIIAIDSRPLVSGYNGTPSGMEHCDHTCNCGRDQVPLSVLYNLTDEERKHSKRCPANTPCVWVVHAEANAIAFAARHGIQIGGAKIFTTLSPCYTCSQLIINAGIVEVVYEIAYRDTTGLALLQQAGVTVCQHTP